MIASRSCFTGIGVDDGISPMSWVRENKIFVALMLHFSRTPNALIADYSNSALQLGVGVSAHKDSWRVDNKQNVETIQAKEQEAFVPITPLRKANMRGSSIYQNVPVGRFVTC